MYSWVNNFSFSVYKNFILPRILYSNFITRWQKIIYNYRKRQNIHTSRNNVEVFWATSIMLHGLGRSFIKSILYTSEICARGRGNAAECIIVLVIYRRAMRNDRASSSLHHRAVTTVSVMPTCLGAVDGLFTRQENLRR